MGATYIPDVLETIGYVPAMAGWAAAADTRIGRVVRVDRGVAHVLTEQGPLRAGFSSELLCDMARDVVATPCAGDWVVVRDWPDHRETVHRVLPRRTAVVRATAGEQSHGQVLVANADIVAVVVALEPLPVIARIERLVALAWQSGARPLVVLTKADAVSDAVQVAEDVAEAVPGVEVVRTSVVTGEGVDRLRALVDGRLTLALIGSSGHGKSSLTNAVVGAEVLPTKAIRSDGRGRHTTVRRELVPLPTGGAVIDTPGLKGLGLVDAGEGIARTFSDIEALAVDCRFADCSHQGEPGCAVESGLADGILAQRRYDSWRKLRREAAFRAQRREQRVKQRRAEHGKKAR
jgi:ribosome biogenesis GTPase